MPFTTSDNNFGPTKWSVNSTAGLATHTTLATAMAAASSGDSIILETSVTENVTITPGVNIVGLASSSANLPSITGTLTMTGAGTSTISGLTLITNSAAIIAVTGSAASILNVQVCYLNCSNNTGITYSSSSASSGINIYNCRGDQGTTGISLFSHSSTGQLYIDDLQLTNSGSTLTASTVSAGSLLIVNSNFGGFITSSGSTAIIQGRTSTIGTTGSNTIAITHGSSSVNNKWIGCNFASGTASAISVSTGCTFIMDGCNIDCTNTNAITGAGVITYSAITFSAASNTINTTTQTGCGTLQGSKNTAPSAGFLGEQIRSFNSSGQASPGSPNAFNITSISVTAGIWDISGIALGNFTGLGTVWGGTITSSSATFATTSGDNASYYQFASISAPIYSASIPSFRVTLSATTTYYLVGIATFSTGACTAYGRISATRVG